MLEIYPKGSNWVIVFCTITGVFIIILFIKNNYSNVNVQLD